MTGVIRIDQALQDLVQRALFRLIGIITDPGFLGIRVVDRIFLWGVLLFLRSADKDRKDQEKKNERHVL